MTFRRPGCDYCRQCGGEFAWLRLTPEHRERLFCRCQWEARLKHADNAVLEALREEGDEVARQILMRRMLPAGKAA